MILNGRMRRRTAFAVLGALFAIEFSIGFASVTASADFLLAVERVVTISTLTNVLLVTFLPLKLFVCVRRFHDMNYSGWWLLLYVGWIAASVVVDEVISLGAGAVVSLMGNFALLAFLTTPGTPGPNRHGSDPRGPKRPELADALL